jgi:hypothetical protein
VADYQLSIENANYAICSVISFWPPTPDPRPLFSAKQTQFPERSNEHNLCLDKVLRKPTTSHTRPKQTQPNPISVPSPLFTVYNPRELNMDKEIYI